MNERRHNKRVILERGHTACIMGIDGTWRRQCTLNDVSATGAKLTVEGSIEGLSLKEFFLLLSSTGLAYRRCELAWVNGQQMGVNYLSTKAGFGSKAKKKTSLEGNSEKDIPSQGTNDPKAETLMVEV